MAIADYIKTIWANGSAPAINADNLNKIEDGIDAVTDEAIRLDSVTAALVSPNDIQFTPQDPVPAESEALLFYDDTKKDFAYYDDTGEIHHITQSLNVRVHNDSGATIDAGMAIKYNGGTVAGIPTIALAQADLLSNARVIGITKAPILNGTVGTIVTDGVINDLDTTAYTAGVNLYLSDTVAGGLTPTPPAIVCRVGGALTSDANGELAVRIENYATLPTALTSMSGGSAGVDITTTWTDITGYTAIEEIIMTGNTTTGEILAPVSGSYTISVNFTVTFDAIGAAPEFLYLRLVGDLGYVGISIPYSIARDGEGASMYPSITGTLVAGENYKLQVSSSATLANAVYSFVSFELEAKRLVP